MPGTHTPVVSHHPHPGLPVHNAQVVAVLHAAVEAQAPFTTANTPVQEGPALFSRHLPVLLHQPQVLE